MAVAEIVGFLIGIGICFACFCFQEDLSLCVSSFIESELRNPTYDEMIQFINEDKTNFNEYITNSYVCDNFAKDLINNAKSKGYRAGFVTEFTYSHAVVCFDTEQGLYFVEPQTDEVWTQNQYEGYRDNFPFESKEVGTNYNINWFVI